MKFKLCVLFPIALICSFGCDQKQAEPLPDPHAISIEINIIEDRKETVEDLLRMLGHLAEKGHIDIAINGTYIYLPCMCPPVWDTRRTNTNKAFRVNFPLDHGLPNVDSEIQTLSKWVKQEGVGGVAVSFGRKIPLSTALPVLDYFNENDIYFAICNSTNENETTFTKLEKLH